MRKYNPAEFSFQSVKGEVSEAMQFDWKRDKVDDAKKRAIYQATSYDDFTARVKGCTLKPTHKNEFNAPPKFAFNRLGGPGAGAPGGAPLARLLGAAPGTPGSTATAAAGASAAAAAARARLGAGVLPRNGRELDRELRRRTTPEDKARLLADLDGDLCAQIFSKELDAELLRHIFLILEESAAPGAARRLLKDLAFRCPTQTAMAATFLTPQERGVAARILARDSTADAEEDVRICAALGIPPASVEAARSLSAAAPRPHALAKVAGCNGEGGAAEGTGTLKEQLVAAPPMGLPTTAVDESTGTAALVVQGLAAEAPMTALSMLGGKAATKVAWSRATGSDTFACDAMD